jgi:putative transposase
VERFRISCFAQKQATCYAKVINVTEAPHRTHSSFRAIRDLRAIFESTDRLEAERRLRQTVDKYAQRAPKLSAWLEANVAESFTVFAFPETHRRRLRTSNLMERISKELKRRTRVATLFPNEASLLRLVSAVLMEISEEWETEQTYLRMENLNSPEQS